MLELRNVFFSYPNGKSLLEDISFCIKPYEKVALMGANAVGKSTLARLMCGLLKPTRGNILIDGKSIAELKRKKYSFPKFK